ncbi:NAD(+) diphosphatase [Methylobacterium nodulans]|uniref:NAD(+) diphosphatase n=1 Tax=Methylobacterium nodulans (strain LMG 21967 / CNCM I-2342 / ORS 2060) TaxID=460265 RepID=B8II16_METNO|nr:NAD(+) diphosphatase [Methylobacterium nodulans]ACL56054.1 NUDIX hydrolase [Methylobacterium nodulans ORS 2060]
MITPLDRLGFAQSLLVRHSAERTGPTPTLADHPEAGLVLFAGEIPVLRRAGESASAILTAADGARAPAPLPLLFLGRVEARPVFAGALPVDAAASYAEDPSYRVLDLRSIAVEGAVPPAELGLLATAKSLLSWHARHGFCANCGAPTTIACGGFRRDCSSCGSQHFPRTDPVVIMLVTRGDHCLLGRQARFLPGVYSCLAGFLEPGETIEDAVRRETFEEAGLRVGAVHYRASQPWPFPSSLMIGCEAEALHDELVLDREELEDARWFSREEVRRMLERRHPDGLLTPPPMAIANLLVRGFADGF